MDFTNKHTVRVTSYLLFLLAATQALYTLLRMAGIDFPRPVSYTHLTLPTSDLV